MGRILITGGSGMIGSRLKHFLREKKYEIRQLSRTKPEGQSDVFQWDIPSRYVEEAAFDGVTDIVHLAGAGIADKPWTKKRKQEILESRTRSSRLLFEYLKSHRHQVNTFVSASAIGYYGFDDNDTVFDENSSPGNDFLAEVVRKWEAEVDQIAQLGIRVVKVRVGIVLSEKGGVLYELAKPVKFFVGAPLASGLQKISWIHVDDVCGVFMKALEDVNISGAINAVGPYAVTNRELVKTVATVLDKPILLPPVPAFALRLLFGEMADLVIKGNAVANTKLIKSGFQYKFSTLETAVADLLG